MFSKIYESVLMRKLINFVDIFSDDSKSIFKGSSDKLIHPGEFGKYREECCKDILKLLLKTDAAVSDGFIITSDNRISTQCDIIVYNASLSPLITNDIAKMFPIEEVRAIGEIKSNLSKYDFEKALIKLSENKSLYEARSSDPSRRKYNSKSYDTVGSFLICNKLDFDYSKIDIDVLYGDTPRKYWHNAILSIEDGLIIYSLDYRDEKTEIIECLKAGKYDINKASVWAYPNFEICGYWVLTKYDFIPIQKNDPYYHIITFFVSIVECINDVCIYEHDFINYLGLSGGPFFLND